MPAAPPCCRSTTATVVMTGSRIRMRRLAAGAALVGAVGVVPHASAQSAPYAGTGAAYATRDPARCPAVRSVPSATQAAQIVQCSLEHPGWLYEHVTVQIGGGRPAQYDGYSDLDRSKSVYPIRGSFTVYRCQDLKEYPSMAPNNCSVSDVRAATGICYQTTFGDWRCKMSGELAARPAYERGPR